MFRVALSHREWAAQWQSHPAAVLCGVEFGIVIEKAELIRYEPIRGEDFECESTTVLQRLRLKEVMLGHLNF